MILTSTKINVNCSSHQEFRVMHLNANAAGGRGVKMEMWTNKIPARLEEALSYNENTSGYSTNWTDSLSYIWQQEIDNFVARLSGFFVPTETDNYTFYIKGDDRTALYFSHTGNPQDKVCFGRMVWSDFHTDWPIKF